MVAFLNMSRTWFLGYAATPNRNLTDFEGNAMPDSITDERLHFLAKKSQKINGKFQINHKLQALSYKQEASPYGLKT